MTTANRAEITALKITPIKVNKINYALDNHHYKDPDVKVFEFLIKKHLGKDKLGLVVLKTFFKGDIEAINQILQDTTKNLNLMEFKELKYIAKEGTIEMQHCIKDLYLSALVNKSLNFASKEYGNICEKFVYTFLDCLQPYTNLDYSSNCNHFGKYYFNSASEPKDQIGYFNFITHSSPLGFGYSHNDNDNAEILKNCFSALAFVIFENNYIPSFEKRLIVSEIISLYNQQLDHKKVINISNALLEKYHDPSDILILSKFEAVLNTLEIQDPVSTQLSKMIIDAIEPSNKNTGYSLESIFGKAYEYINYLHSNDNSVHANNIDSSLDK